MRLQIFILDLSILLAILALYLGFCGTNLDKPFIRNHSFNGVEYGTFARNILRFGIIKTKLGSLYFSGIFKPLENQNQNYNIHHPFVLPLIISGSYALFGVSEFSTRLPFFIFSGLSLCLLYLLGRKLHSRLFGIFIVLFALATPMLRYYAIIPSHEPILLFLMLFLLFYYVKYLDKKSSQILKILLITTFVIGITGWPGYAFIPPLLLHNLIIKKSKFDKKLLFLPLILLITFCLHLLHIKILTGSFGENDFYQIFLFRINASNIKSLPDWFDSTETLYRHLVLVFNNMFTEKLVGLAGLGLFLTRLKSLFDPTIKKLFSLTILLFFMPILYVLVFSNAMMIHDYLAIYFLPFFVFATGLNLLSFSNKNYFSKLITITLGLLIFINVFKLGQVQISVMTIRERPNDGIEIGKYINETTQLGDKILILSSQLRQSANKWIYFYSDRDVYVRPQTYSSFLNLIDKNKFSEIIVYKKEVPDSQIMTYLHDNFSTQDLDKITVFRPIN